MTARLPKSSSAADGHRAYRLVVVSGPSRGREVVISPARGAHVVGVAEECALVLEDRLVSRRHLELEAVADGLSVRDLGSKNGSTYDGARFTHVVVRVGAVVRIGDSELKVLSAAHYPRASVQLLPSSATRFGGLVGRSLRMREAFALLERVAPTETTVLIEGETGTGKELCAEALHAASLRAGGPFVVCDLAGMSRSLIESELFGHRKGAFTGADTDRDGLFVDAARGTVFIDEIGELDRALQPRLLRLLERRQVRPVGGSYEKIDVRVVAATHRDLDEEVREKRFRTDLFHRLAVVRVRLPSLRERKEDIPLLIEHALGDRAVELHEDTLALLTEYDWPGNVRELFNVIQRALSLLGDRRVIEPSLLGFETTQETALEPFHALKARLVADWERRYLTELLRRAKGNVARAAAASGLQRTYLYEVLRKHDLAPR